MVTRKDYLDEAVQAARSVMIELAHLLGEYRESLVLIGGWVPELLLPNRDRPHVGSIDVDLAFIDPIEVTVEGQLPGGGKDSVKIQVASLVTFLVMKGMALDDRLKEKDAWDINYCVRNYPGGLDALTDELRPHLGHGLVKEGLQKIAKHFASESHIGPTSVADFEEIKDPEERALIQRDAYERVTYVLSKLEGR